jgi:hypothetical protein
MLRPLGPIVALAAVACVGLPAVIAQPPPAIPDAPFAQEFHEAFPLSSAAENDVRALTFDEQGRLWAATGDGVRFLDDGRWKTPPGGRELGSSYAVYGDESGSVWVGAWNGLYRASPEQVQATEIHGAPISAISSARQPGTTVDILFAAGPDGIWKGGGANWTKVDGAWHRAIRTILPGDDGRLWIGTASGLYLADLHNPHETTRLSRPDRVLSSNIQALVRLNGGAIAVASTGGLDFYLGGRRLRPLSAPEGVPCRNARAVAEDASGRLWVATALGVARFDRGGWALRHSRRWLASDDVRHVTIGPDGTAWAATSAGVDAIRSRPMTLAEKADYFLQMLRARHIRPPGLVGPAVLAGPGDVSRSFIEDDDNDGEHTGMYCAMESMRYAVTRNPEARENAKAAFHALVALQRATGTPHFIARSVLPAGTAPRHETDRAYSAQEIADARRTDPRGKIIERRWLPTEDGKWLWKRDASSDEVDGHMFGYATYYDLAADDGERRLVADQVDRIVGGIVDHGYTLQDIDGKPTQWGNWSPASLNGDPTWHEERPGNSVEMIAYLGTAYHITGNEKYRDAARYLIDKHGYAKNMLDTSFDTPSERTHIEDELLTMVYANLLTHPVFASLKPVGELSMQRWHRSAERDGIPFYDFVYNRFSGRRMPLDRAVETLRDWPLDMVEWTVDNSRREDVRRDLTPGLDDGRLTRILPRSEMGICMWDQEPYKAVIGNDGRREDKPTDWLLAYWMGRYYGLLGP